MAVLPLRLLGLLLLTLAIVIPSCQAVFIDREPVESWTPGFLD